MLLLYEDALIWLDYDRNGQVKMMRWLVPLILFCLVGGGFLVDVFFSFFMFLFILEV